MSLISISHAWFTDGSRLTNDGQDFFTSYDEVYESFDAMGLQENLLRGIYAYGMLHHSLLLLFFFFPSYFFVNFFFFFLEM